MELLHSKALVARVARAWRDQYPENGTSGPNNRDAVYEALRALDIEIATPGQVADIIGNKSWSYYTCDECDQYVERAVQVANDGSTICVSCARAIAALASVVL